MQRVLILVQDRQDAPLAASAVAAAAECEQIPVVFDPAQSDGALRGRADLIVAVAGRDAERASGFLRWLRQKAPPAPILIGLPEAASCDLYRQSFAFADDVTAWPPLAHELRWRLKRLLRTRWEGPQTAETNVARDLGLSRLVGCAPAFEEVLRRIPHLAAADAPILITGETGTGKELCARAIHHLSRRRNCAFIAVDCAAIPEQLFENEMFGHARGAFTDARIEQRGLAALADGGILFLDEIDSLPVSCQSKLLRFMDEHAYRPLGSDRFYKADVNVVVATNKDLQACVRAGRFRADVLFRLDVLRLQIPPLRERKADLTALSDHFLDNLAAQAGKPRKTIAPAAMRKLCLHDWPGNVRELFNVLHRAAIACGSAQIGPEHISVGGAAADSPALTFRAARAQTIEAFERSYVEQLLRENHGNVTHAARQAGQDRRAFGRLAKKYNVGRLDTEPGRFGASGG